MVRRRNDARANHVVAIIIIIITIVIDAVFAATVVNALKFCNETADRIVPFVDRKAMSRYACTISDGQKIDVMHQNRHRARNHAATMKTLALIIANEAFDANEAEIRNASKIRLRHGRDPTKKQKPTIKSQLLQPNVSVSFVSASRFAFIAFIIICCI